MNDDKGEKAQPRADLPMELVATQNVGAHTATSTIVSYLLLARFVEPKLEWTYTTPYLVTTRIKFQELPHEYATPPPALPEPAYLFIFNEINVRVDYYTSYENTITLPSGTYMGTYVPAPFSFDVVKKGLKLDEEKIEIKSFRFDANPLNKMFPFALDGMLTVTILEVDANNLATTPVVRFYGDIWSIDSSYKATAVPFGNLFARKFPRFLLSVSDNYTQFSPPTQLNLADFDYSGTFGVIDYNSQIVTVTSAAGWAKGIDFFAGGWIENRPFPDNKFEQRGILHSESIGTNQVRLHLDRPLIKTPTGRTFVMYPGYDGSINDCVIKFNNRINFGGHPYIPNVNPGVKAVKAKKIQGGKKS